MVEYSGQKRLPVSSLEALQKELGPLSSEERTLIARAENLGEPTPQERASFDPASRARIKKTVYEGIHQK